jgi:hypothetical protein
LVEEIEMIGMLILIIGIMLLVGGIFLLFNGEIKNGLLMLGGFLLLAVIMDKLEG